MSLVRYCFGINWRKILIEPFKNNWELCKKKKKKTLFCIRNQENPPTFSMFKQTMQDTLQLEFQAYAIKDKEISKNYGDVLLTCDYV